MSSDSYRIVRVSRNGYSDILGIWKTLSIDRGTIGTIERDTSSILSIVTRTLVPSQNPSIENLTANLEAARYRIAELE
jgi:hypothetical protein